MKRSASFDFNQAVAQARRDYPEETAKTVFADTSTLRGRRAVKKYLKNTYGAQYKPTSPWWKRTKTERKIKRLLGLVMREKKLEFRIEPGVSWTYPGTDQSILCVNTKRVTKEPGGFLSNLHLAFNHELGHIVLAHTQKTDTHEEINHDENAADSFALMRCIHQGVLSDDAATILYDARAARAAHTDIEDDEHRMTPETLAVLKKILNNNTPAQLTPQKVKKIALKI